MNLKEVKKLFKEKGCYEVFGMSIGGVCQFILDVDKQDYVPYLTKAIEYIASYNDIDGNIALGINKNWGNICMDLNNLDLKNKKWITKEEMHKISWNKVIEVFDTKLFPISSPEVCFAKLRNNRFVFWELNGKCAYLYTGLIKDYKDVKGKNVLTFEVGNIRKSPTQQESGYAHSGRTNSWGIKITIPKKHSLIKWEELRKDIIEMYKKLIED